MINVLLAGKAKGNHSWKG